MILTSAQNPSFKWLKSLSQKKYRDKEDVLILEGTRIVDHALDLGIVPRAIFYRVSGDLEVSPYESRGAKSYGLVPSLFDEVADTVHAQGVLAVCDRRSLVGQSPVKGQGLNHVLVLDQVQDPGNLGTLIRTADAMGIYDVYLLKGTVDAYSPKVLRSTMGAIFSVRLHIQEDPAELLSRLKEEGYTLAATALQNSVPLSDLPLDKPLAIILGNEGNGVSSDVIERCDIAVRIPMVGHAESLNVAIAGGIVMYHVSLACSGANAVL